jgi:transglutaminase-like putative cysteine protease
MTDYVVEYRTLTEYEKTVKQGVYEFLIMPCDNETQKLKLHRLLYSMSRAPFMANNKYGFVTLHFHANKETFEYFSLNLLAQVAKNAPPMDLFSNLGAAEEKAALEDFNFQMDHQSFLHSTTLSKLKPGEFSDYLLLQAGELLGTYLQRLNNEVHNLLRYLSGSTHTRTSALDALLGGAGVCQDFAHIMIGILRNQGIPARYVSGYLNLTNNASDSQLHAWVEVYIPQVGWRGFDPTNNTQETDQFIKIAHGRDYLDCQPIKGVLNTEGGHKTSYEVSVRNGNDYNWFLQEQQQQQQQ